MHHVRLEPARCGVRFSRVGVELNLGSIGKGYALDRAAEILRREFGVESALLHGGHSSVYAIGSGPDDERGWPVGVTHPWLPSRRLAIVHLKDRGLGTSAATFQHLEWRGRKLGHVLDPRRGWPAAGIASATVLAASAADADALSTGLFILGESAAARLAEQREDLSMILLPEGPKATTTVVGR
jgi:thiamine biosynthesis lipoprotein